MAPKVPLPADFIDRAIDEAIRLQIMRHDPPPHVYARILDATRVLSSPRRDVGSFRSLTIAASSIVATVLLVDLALRAFGSTALQVESAAAERGPLFLIWLSSTALARWINESESMLGYPGFLFLHTLGLAVVVGVSMAIDLRLLGAAPRIAMSAMRPLFRYMWIGFWVNAVSGMMLFAADAQRKADNPFFEAKLAFVALGVMLMALIERQLVRRDADSASVTSPARLRLLAIGSLLAWVAAIAAGRLIAYAF
jgi:hypothetical protein